MSSDPMALADARERRARINEAIIEGTVVRGLERVTDPLERTLYEFAVRYAGASRTGDHERAVDAMEWALAALRACPAESAGSVTLSIEEHRRLLIRAGEHPAGMFVRIAERRSGPHPSEAHVAITTETSEAFCFLSERSIIAGHVSIGWPVGQKPGFLLVEMPRECDDGRWRIWVPETNVTREPEEAAIRALPDQPAGGGDA